jgi:hypothetical protein
VTLPLTEANGHESVPHCGVLLGHAQRSAVEAAVDDLDHGDVGSLALPDHTSLPRLPINLDCQRDGSVNHVLGGHCPCRIDEEGSSRACRMALHRFHPGHGPFGPSRDVEQRIGERLRLGRPDGLGLSLDVDGSAGGQAYSSN